MQLLFNFPYYFYSRAMDNTGALYSGDQLMINTKGADSLESIAEKVFSRGSLIQGRWSEGEGTTKDFLKKIYDNIGLFAKFDMSLITDNPALDNVVSKEYNYGNALKLINKLVSEKIQNIGRGTKGRKVCLTDKAWEALRPRTADFAHNPAVQKEASPKLAKYVGSGLILGEAGTRATPLAPGFLPMTFFVDLNDDPTKVAVPTITNVSQLSSTGGNAPEALKKDSIVSDLMEKCVGYNGQYGGPDWVVGMVDVTGDTKGVRAGNANEGKAFMKGLETFTLGNFDIGDYKPVSSNIDYWWGC